MSLSDRQFFRDMWMAEADDACSVCGELFAPRYLDAENDVENESDEVQVRDTGVCRKCQQEADGFYNDWR